MSQQVFISYSRRDGNIHAEKLEQELKSAGYKVWRDTRNINPNQDFTAEIEKGIEASDVIAVCVTPDIRRDNSFVRREIQYADVVQKPAFPCRVTDAPPPISIINKEWLNFYEDWSGAFSRLLTLVADPNLQQPTGEYQAPPDDPYRDYLQSLYKQIVRYLDQAVIKLIDLEAETSPDAVPNKQTDDILLEFFETLIHTKDTLDELPRHTTFKDAFEHHKGRLLLLGEPGAGKTITLMAHAREAVATRLEDPMQALPILKLLATWKSNPPAPLVDWSAGKMEALKPVIAGGKALLLLDGLDELGEERPVDPQKPEGEKYDPRKRLIDAVGDLHADNQVLVTCRVKDYAAIGQQISLDGAITLQPLTDAQLTDYLEDRPEIYAAIQADDQLRDLARTPLLLSLITFAWDKLDTALKDKGDLQAGDVRDAIFEAYCRQRYEHEAKKRNADLPFTYQKMMDILGELAMWNAQKWRPGKEMFEDDDLEPEENALIPYDFEYVIGDSERAEHFKQLTSHLNILTSINEIDYRFVHLLLRDFLVYTFALPRLREQSFLREGKYTKFNPAIALATFNDRRAVEPLIACLSDENEDVRQSAVGALGEIGGARAVEPLIACLSDENEDVRQSAVEALGEIGDVRAVEPLIACLSDENEDVRQSVAEALGRIGDVRAVEPLIACLSDENDYLRRSAVEALGEIGGTRAVEPLIACLSDESEWVSRSAVEVLGKIGGARAVEPLIACLSDETSRARQNAALVLGAIGDERAVEPLVALLKDEAILFIVVEALARIDEAALQSLLENEEPIVRAYTAIILSEIDSHQATQYITRLLNDFAEFSFEGETSRVCDVVYARLQEIGTPDALQACDEWVRAGNIPPLMN